MKFCILILLAVSLMAQPGAPVGGYGGALVGSATNPNGTVCVVNTAVALLFQSTIYTCQSGTYQILTSSANNSFPITVSGTVTSGGIPCFTSTTVEASSGALGANLPVIGGGSGVCPSVGTVTGNTTKFVTGTGAYTNGHGLLVDANGNIIDSGSAPTGGTGNAAAFVTTTFSATPTYTCPTSTAGTVVDFVLSTTLTANITSSTLATCTTGSVLNFRFQQDATGGRTVIMPTGFEACFANPAANIGTKCSYFWDGTNGRLLTNTGDAGYSAGQTVAAPGTPPAGDCFTWLDSTDNRYHDKCNNATTIGTTVVSPVVPTNQVLSGMSTAGVFASAFPAGQVNAQTVSYTAVAADFGKLITENGVSLTLTLPAAPPSAGWYIWILNLAATDLTVARNGLTINGTTSNLTLVQFQPVLIYTDNTNYFAQGAQAGESFFKSLGIGTGPPACTAGTAGTWCLGEGTAFTNVASTAGIYADSTAHEFLAKTNGAAGAGFLVRSQPSPVNQTAQTTAIGTSTLCASAAGACNVAGQYHVHWNFWGSGTACSNVTTGSVTFLLTWTDENATAHSAVAEQMQVQTGAATTAVQNSFPFQTNLANESGSGDITISTNGSIIQYATGYIGCTAGTGTYNLRAAVTRLQ